MFNKDLKVPLQEVELAGTSSSNNWELAEVDNKDRNAKSVKILQQERGRKFKELRGFGVDSCRFP